MKINHVRVNWRVITDGPVRSIKALVVGALLGLGCACGSASASDALQIRDGYLWNPETGRPFIARGPAYQVWNPPVFANQSFEQVEYDLRQFVKLRANSVRAELVWGELEVGDDEYDWSRADFLVETAEELGLKLFMLIGYQYPPSWFPREHLGFNDRETISDVLNYESAEAQAAYAEHIAAVVSRYRDSSAIGAWIIGNEFAYFDLWEDLTLFPSRRMLGYDPTSQAAYRDWLRDYYDGEIAALNENWGTSYADFDEVVMSQFFPEDRNDPSYHDLIQWRKESIGSFLALGARAVKDNDPNHLISYSMVGGIFTGRDANNTCEDPEVIVQMCAEAGAPIDFWSVNNYARASEGSELRSLDFGIAKYTDRIGLPVMLSETGHTSSENLNQEASERQATALPTSLWECLSSGAIGIHFFHWNDRNNFTEDFFLRERGFGIVNQDRTSKGEVYDNVEALFRRMQQLDLADLLAGSRDPEPDIVFYLTPEGEIGFPRANQEHTMLAGALRRLGYQVGLIGPHQFFGGDLGNAKALALSRCEQMKPEVLDRVWNELIPAGIHIHADADLPGRVNAYRQPNANWEDRMDKIFGVGVGAAEATWDGGITQSAGATYRGLSVRGVTALGRLPANFSEDIVTWKIWEGVQSTAGTTILTHNGLDGLAPQSLGLQVRDHGTARVALNTFAAADIDSGASGPRPWDIRSTVIGSIYRDYFGLTPDIELSGENSQYVFPDYRICRNGSILISLLNGSVSPIDFTLESPKLLNGKTVELLSHGGILETLSDGSIDLSVAGDGFLLLYVYDESGGADDSLVDRSPYRVWFESAPQSVWPSVAGFEAELGFDTRGEALDLELSLESATYPRDTVGFSQSSSVSGTGMQQLSLSVLDPDLMDPGYRSSLAGGHYQLRASLGKDGVTVAEKTLPVQLLWGVRPRSLPPEVLAGESYRVEVEWEELPGYLPGEAPSSIDRADLFLSPGAPTGPEDPPAGAKALSQHYNIVLELRDESEEVVASAVHVTRKATGVVALDVEVPEDASGPFHWYAYTETAQAVTSDLIQSFEGWATGQSIPFHQQNIGPTSAGKATYSAILFVVPVEAGSVSVVATIDDSTRSLQDDGMGVLVGEGGDAGTIDYETGDITVTFATAPTVGGEAIMVSFLQRDAANPGVTSPWENFTYAEEGNPARLYLNHGIHIQGHHGSQSVFQVIHNPPDVGGFSGFGLVRQFETPLELPEDPEEQSHYRLSFCFREVMQSPGSCRLEMQLKDGQVNDRGEPAPGVLMIEKIYEPGDDGWDLLGGSFDEFFRPSWSPQEDFDYADVREIVCNVAMLQTDRIYDSSIDHIRLDGPEAVVRGGTVDAIYDSRNDSLSDSDGDGIADVYETGTGIYNGEDDTGTDWQNPDSDGDGQSDGAEVVAGTDPNSSQDRFRADVSLDESGEVVVSWMALAGRRYALEFSDPTGDGTLSSFAPLSGSVPVEVSEDGPVSVKVSRPVGSPARLLRVVAWRDG